MESFGRTSLAWASMGLESHMWIPRAHMMDEKYQTWKALNMTWTTYPSPHMPNDFPRRGKTSHLEACSHLGGLGLGGEVTCIGASTF
jgi:hypothetical protein